jgi:hypothetical protein
MTTLKAFAPMSVAVIALALGACAQNQTRDDRRSDAPAPRAEPARRPVAPEAAPTPPAASAPATPRSAPAAPVGDVDPQFTGIEVCDEYLARYKACHTVIAAFPADQIDSRLETLRKTWQERASDPAQRDSLTAQCQSISDEMETALDGRDCDAPESDFVQPEDPEFDNVEGDSTIAND